MIGGGARLGIVVGLATISVGCTAQSPREFLAFRDVRVFDGESVHPLTTVLITDGHISAVGPEVVIPPTATVIEGEGRTLLPGLIDAHVHLAAGLLRKAIMFGVTTELSMGDDPVTVAELKERALEGGLVDRSDVLSSGVVVTPPSGHGAGYGQPTLASAGDAESFVAARVQDGADYIKAVYQFGMSDVALRELGIPVFDRETLASVVAAAHRHNKLVVVHINTVAAAREAVEVGADGLAHIFFDEVADEDIARLLGDNGVFVTTTLATYEGLWGTSPVGLAEDDRLLPFLGPDEVGRLRGFDVRARNRLERGISNPRLDNLLSSVDMLHRYGVPILAGTDMLVPDAGVPMHRELELLVTAGLHPEEALRSATSAPADAYGLNDRGRIRPGLRADLVLVRGDPTADIRLTRDIVGVWKLGAPVDREEYRREKAAASEALRNPTRDLLLSDFEQFFVGPSVGWMNSRSDQANGGSSVAEWEVVDGGANGTERSLAVRGIISVPDREVENPFWFEPYAGVVFSVGPLNLSAKRSISFWARGEGDVYRVLLEAEDLGGTPAQQMFVASTAWEEFSFLIDDFEGVDPTAVQAVVISGPVDAGPFAFHIDEVRIH